MAALSTTRDTQRLVGYSSAEGQRKYKLRGGRIFYAGALLMLGADNLVRPAGPASGAVPAGRCPVTIDTTGLPDGAAEVVADYGCFGGQNAPDMAAGETLFFEGEAAFMLDDQSFTKTNRSSTLSAAGKVAKVQWDGGQPLFLWGGKEIDGAAAAGDVHWTAKTNGVTITVTQGADGDSLLISVVDKAVSIRTAAAAGAVTTTANALKTYFDTDSGAGATAARALLSLQVLGAGTGLLAASASADVGDGGGLVYFAKASSGFRVKHVVAGTNTALSVSVTGSDITVNLATDGNKDPTSTAADIKTAIDASAAASALVAVRCFGAGTGIGGAWDFQTGTYLFTGLGNQVFVAAP